MEVVTERPAFRQSCQFGRGNVYDAIAFIPQAIEAWPEIRIGFDLLPDGIEFGGINSIEIDYEYAAQFAVQA